MRYPKSIRKELRTLVSTAYERELNNALEDLYLDFDKWKNEQIDCFELSQLIHGFHQKKSRELWKIYNQTDDGFIVVRAIRLGVLQQKEVSTKTAEAMHLDRLMKLSSASGG